MSSGHEHLAAPVGAALRAARSRIAAVFERPEATARTKADGSTVTDLDVELERSIGEALLAIEPTFGLRGEEGALVREGNPVWVLDPLDGTANFARRVPTFAVQVVLMDGDTPRFAAIYEPLRDDLAWAAEGAGTWLEGERVSVADTPVGREMICVDVSDSGLFVDRPALLPSIRRAVFKVRAMGSIGIHLRDVGIGRMDGFVGGRGTPSKIHDVGPGTLLVREAGGVVTNAEGGDAIDDPRSMVAAAPRLHERLMALLAT